MRPSVFFSAFVFVCAALCGSVTVSAQTVLHQFGATPNDGIGPNAVIQASDGNLYGVTGGGGTAGLGTIFSLSTTGTYKQLYSFQGGADGQAPFVAMVQAEDGYLYGISTISSTAGGSEIFRIWPGASTLQVVYSFPAGVYVCGNLVPDRLGHLYGETLNGGKSAAGSIFRIGQTSGHQLLHSFPAPATGVCGTPIVASDGFLYGAVETGLFKMAKSGADFNIFHLFSSEAYPPYRPSGGLTEGADGNVYGFASGGRLDQGVLYKIAPGSDPTESIALFGGDKTNFFVTGTLSADGAGNLYSTNTLGDDQESDSLEQINLADPSFVALGSAFTFENSIDSQPLMAGDGNLYAPTRSRQGGSIITYPLSNGPVARLTASKNSLMKGDELQLTFSVDNAFSNTMKECFLTDNTRGGSIVQVGVKGSVKLKTDQAGTITYGYECGGVESATAVVTVEDCDR